MKKISAVALVLLAAALPAAAQSIDITDGSNAVGLGFHGELDTGSLLELGGHTAFSIAGIMDIGAYFATATETVNGVEGSNRTLGAILNLMPLKQRAGVPFSLQLRLRYGATFVDRDLVVAELEDRDVFEEVRDVESTRTGYSLGAGLTRDVPLGPLLTLRLGADAEFRAARSIYRAVFSAADGDDDDDDETEESVGFRETSVLYGPSAGISVRFPRGPVLAFTSRFLFDDDQELVFRPELSLILLQYQ